MRKAVTLTLVFFALAIAAQDVKIDKGLKSLVDAVVSLRQSDKANSVKTVLRNNKQWTLMDELKDENDGECWLTKKMKRFNLIPLINGVLTERYGSNIPGGDFLNGEDPRFNYSLIEKGIKAKKKVKYTFQGRVGKQDFVFVPCDPSSTNLNIKFSKGSSPLKTVQKKDKDGTVYLHIDTKLKSDDIITLEIENRSDVNVAVAILNHNTRK